MGPVDLRFGIEDVLGDWVEARTNLFQFGAESIPQASQVNRLAVNECRDAVAFD